MSIAKSFCKGIRHMETPLENYEACMRKVLVHVQNKGELSELPQYERRVLKYCCEKGYVSGIVPFEAISGTIKFDVRTGFDPELTYEGLQFLYAAASSADPAKETCPQDYEKTDSAAQKTFEIVKSIFKKFWALFCGLGVVVTVFGWPLIKDFFAFLLSLFK